MTYLDQLHIEIVIDDLLEALAPNSTLECEEIAESLHTAVENSIKDYIDGNDELDYNDYDPVY